MKGGKQKVPGNPGVWAFLTVVCFPIVLITFDILGFEGFSPFLLALAATFLVLLLEALVRGRIWIFEEDFVDHIAHPEMPARIIIFVGAILLILETALIFAVATNRRMDPALLGLVMRKACSARHEQQSAMLCRFLQEPATVQGAHLRGIVDPLGYAIREHASAVWFPDDPLTACAVRSLKQSVVTDPSKHAIAVVHCSAWRLDSNGALRLKEGMTKFAEALLRKEEDGLYRIVTWKDDTSAPQGVSPVALTPSFVTALQAEALARAQQRLK